MKGAFTRPGGGAAARRPSRRGGFTLAEVLIAMAILGVILSSISLVYLGTIDRRRRHESRETARFLAQEEAERWIASGGGSGPSGRWTERSVKGFPAFSRELRWETLPGGATRAATVEVRGSGTTLILKNDGRAGSWRVGGRPDSPSPRSSSSSA